MSDQVYNIINSAIVLLAAIVGSILTYFQQKGRHKQGRVDSFLEKRMKVYGEGLQFVYDVEQNQANEKGLEEVMERWKKWYPLNAVHLPPSVNDALFGAMHWTVPVIIDLHNDGEVNKETWKIFKDELQKAKTSLMNLEEIGWLPEGLKR